MGVGRPTSYKPAGGSDVSEQICECLKPWRVQFGVKGVPYTSRCMKTGIDLAQMKVVASALEELMALGPRGGRFDNQDAEAGVGRTYDDE